MAAFLAFHPSSYRQLCCECQVRRTDLHTPITGINFPAYAFENQADTEGFAAMAKRAGFGVFGLPNYIVWHIDTEEKEGNLKGRPKDKEADET